MITRGAFPAIQPIILKTSWFRIIHWNNKGLRLSYCKQSINTLKFNWQSLLQRLPHRTVRLSNLNNRGVVAIYKSNRTNMICKWTPMHLRQISIYLLPCHTQIAATLSSKPMCTSPLWCTSLKKAIKITKGVAQTILRRRKKSSKFTTFSNLSLTWSPTKG